MKKKTFKVGEEECEGARACDEIVVAVGMLVILYVYNIEIVMKEWLCET